MARTTEGDLHVNKDDHFAIPATKGVELHLNKRDIEYKTKPGESTNIVVPMTTTSDEGDSVRYRQTDRMVVAPPTFQRKGIRISNKNP